MKEKFIECLISKELLGPTHTGIVDMDDVRWLLSQWQECANQFEHQGQRCHVSMKIERIYGPNILPVVVQVWPDISIEYDRCPLTA